MITNVRITVGMFQVCSSNVPLNFIGSVYSPHYLVSTDRCVDSDENDYFGSNPGKVNLGQT